MLFHLLYVRYQAHNLIIVVNERKYSSKLTGNAKKTKGVIFFEYLKVCFYKMMIFNAYCQHKYTIFTIRMTFLIIVYVLSINHALAAVIHFEHIPDPVFYFSCCCCC